MFRNILLCSLFLNVFIASSAELHIKSYGIEHIDRRDVGMVFFVEVKNNGKLQMALNVRMIKCCETISADDIDCEHIQVIGGHMGMLDPHGVRNLTLIWPMLYLHNRVGECVIGIAYTGKNNKTGEIRQKIHFDTSLTANPNPPILQVEPCMKPDLDELDYCRPMNCHVKYSGKRNFFNQKLQKCQAVPVCIADPSKELPDVNMYCHHGYGDNATGFCICKDGWTSHSIDDLEPSTEKIHMCNVRMLPFPRLRATHLRTILMIILSLLIFLAVMFCCAMIYVKMEFDPSAKTLDSAQQTGGSSCVDSSTRTLTSCCSSRATGKTTARKNGCGGCPIHH